jgi:hypothetical protein
MDKVLLVSVIALAVALLSMLVNLALVWKISDLKNKLEWVELTVNDRTSQLHKDDVEISNQLNKLECNTKDAFEKLTNHLTRHDDQIDKLVDGYKALEIIVNKHTKQLEDLGNFAGITTGELRVLEQKIYNSCKPKELPEPEPITKQISERIKEASLEVNVKTNNIEISSLGTRLSILENKIKQNLTENGLVTRVNKLEHQVSTLERGFTSFKGSINRVVDNHMVEVDRKIRNRMVLVDEVDIRKHKPDRKRKDNYYRKPNKSNVIIDEFASDIIE